MKKLSSPVLTAVPSRGVQKISWVLSSGSVAPHETTIKPMLDSYQCSRIFGGRGRRSETQNAELDRPSSERHPAH